MLDSWVIREGCKVVCSRIVLDELRLKQGQIIGSTEIWTALISAEMAAQKAFVACAVIEAEENHKRAARRPR